MKNISVIGVLLLGLVLSACTSQRYGQSSEYDDVYYTRADQPEPEVVNTRTQRNDPYASEQNISERRQREPVDSYYDTYYSNDDFFYSRRLRRFDSRQTNSWRYYDPYFSNDLYFVMGSNRWNRWYRDYGWYSWNSPRFGSPYSPYGGGIDNWYWSGYNNRSTWGNPYYNPWVDSYYGYNAGWGFYDPWGSPFGGGGFNSALYCPPGYYPRNSVAVASGGSRTAPVTRRRNSTVSSRTQTTLNGRNNSGAVTGRKNDVRTTRTVSPSRTDYTRPKPTITRTSRTRNGNGTVTRQNPTRSTRTVNSDRSRSPRTVNRNSTNNGRSTVRTRPNSGRVNRSTSPSSRSPQVRQRNYSNPGRSNSSSGSVRRNNSSPSMQRSNSSQRNTPSVRSNSSSSKSRSGSGSVRRRNN